MKNKCFFFVFFLFEHWQNKDEKKNFITFFFVEDRKRKRERKIEWKKLNSIIGQWTKRQRGRKREVENNHYERTSKK